MLPKFCKLYEKVPYKKNGITYGGQKIHMDTASEVDDL